MIRTYNNDDRQTLCELFSKIIEQHKDYISHGELQMGIATDRGVLAPDFRDKWLKYLDRQLADPLNRILVSHEEGRLAGFVIFGITEDGDAPYGMVYDLGVDPLYRGKGIGHDLLQQALAYFKESGVENCYLESGVDNHSAHRFFERYGFDQVSDIFRLHL